MVPDIDGLVFQATHTDDAADAYRLAVLRDDVRGAFNIAADPPIGPEELAGLLDARVVRVPARAVRTAVAAGWSMRLLPSSPHLLDAFLRLPLMDCARAHAELDWRPRRAGLEALQELLTGLRRGSGLPTPPMTGRRVA